MNSAVSEILAPAGTDSSLSAGYYRAVLDNTIDIISTLAPDGTVTFVNFAVTPALGWLPSDIVGRFVLAFVHPADAAGVQAALTRVMVAPQTTAAVEYRCRTAAREWRYLESVVRNLSEDPHIGGILIISRDVTERRRFQEELLASGEHLKMAHAAGGIGSWEYDPDTHEYFSTRENNALFGLAAASGRVSADRIVELIHPADRDRVMHRFESDILRSRPYQSEFRMTRPDGAERWIFAKAERPPGCRRYIGINYDITDRKLAERELCRSRQQFQALVENSPDIVMRLDTGLRCIYVNRVVEALAGIAPDDCLGRTVSALPWGSDAVRRWESETRRVLDSAHNSRFEFEVDTHGGRRVFEARLVPEFGAESQVESILVIATDITGRKRFESSLRDSEELFHSVFSNAGTGMLIQHASGRIVEANPAFCRILGYSKPELLKMSFRDITFSEDVSRTERIVEAVLSGERQSDVYEKRYTHRDGGIVWARNSISRHQRQGKSPHLIVICEDVTERVESERARAALEEKLAQAQKMDAIGRLAGGIAHDFNNLMTVVLGYGNLLRCRLPEASPLHRELSQVLNAGERAASLTGQLLAFSRRQLIKPRTASLNHEIRSIIDMIRRLLGENIRVTVDLEPDLWNIRIDSDQLVQIVLNLVTNARDAMPAGGDFIMTTSNRLFSPGASWHSVSPGEFVTLSVADTGVGMDDSQSARIFEPFYTTKPVDKGTGLGLSIVYGIVQQNNGTIGVVSEPGRGTCFEIAFPRERGGLECESRPSRAAPPRGAAARILLVEDEPSLREFNHEVLSAAGHIVNCAGNGAEALEIVKNANAPLDLIVSDVVMPGLSGPELVEEIRSRLPRIRVLYVSGYSGEKLDERGLLNEQCAFLPKPYSVDELLCKVADLVGSAI